MCARISDHAHHAYTERLKSTQQHLKPTGHLRQRRLALTWMARACKEWWDLTPETLACASRYYDAVYCSICPSPESNFDDVMSVVAQGTDGLSTNNLCQLLCTACIAIAAKLMETHPSVHLSDLIEFHDQYKPLQKTEAFVLATLEFDLLQFSNPFHFLHEFIPVTAKSTHAGLIGLCSNAITQCTPAEEAAHIGPSLMAAGIIVWGHLVLGIDSTECEDHISAYMRDALVKEKIAEVVCIITTLMGHPVKLGVSTNLPGDVECAICLNNLKRPVETPCSHWYCHDCVMTWQARNGDCPICRTSFQVTVNCRKLRLRSPDAAPQIKQLKQLKELKEVKEPRGAPHNMQPSKRQKK
jgi:hypothetical protein